MRGDVDDAAPATVHHRGHQRLDHRDRGQHVRIERLDEILAVPIAPHAGGWAACVIDQNVDLARGLQHQLLAFVRGDIGGDGGDLDATVLTDAFGGCFQISGTACVHHQIHTRFGQRLCAAQAEAL